MASVDHKKTKTTTQKRPKGKEKRPVKGNSNPSTLHKKAHANNSLFTFQQIRFGCDSAFFIPSKTAMTVAHLGLGRKHAFASKYAGCSQTTYFSHIRVNFGHDGAPVHNGITTKIRT